MKLMLFEGNTTDIVGDLTHGPDPSGHLMRPGVSLDIGRVRRRDLGHEQGQEVFHLVLVLQNQVLEEPAVVVALVREVLIEHFVEPVHVG